MDCPVDNTLWSFASNSSEMQIEPKPAALLQTNKTTTMGDATEKCHRLSPCTNNSNIDKRSRRVKFSRKEPQTFAVESLRYLPLEEKSNLWLQRSEIAHTSKTIQNTIEHSLQVSPHQTIQYVRAVVATYIACTPVDDAENDKNDSNNKNDDTHGLPQVNDINLQPLPALLAAAQSSIPVLRGLESHLSQEMSRERVQRRREYIQGLVELHRMLDDTAPGSDHDLALAALAQRCSLPSRRHAAAVGAADAMALNHADITATGTSLTTNTAMTAGSATTSCNLSKEQNENELEDDKASHHHNNQTMAVPHPEHSTHCAVVPPLA